MLSIPEQYTAYRSEYLTGGYHDDAACLEQVDLTRKSVRGRFRMTGRFDRSDGAFQLSVPIVITWALQLGVIYGGAQHGAGERPELALREISLKCLRPITDPDGIVVRMRLRYRRPVPGGVYYVGDIDVNEGCFAGRIGFTFPVD